VVDPLTVNIVTKEPFPCLPAAMSLLLLQPMGHTSENDEATIGLEPIGTGPYQLVEFTRDLHVIVEAFPGYWGDPPTVERFVWRTIPDASTRMAALQAGEVDLISGVAPEFTEDLEGDGFTIAATGAGLGLVLFFNTLSEGPLQDARVRQALNLAVDKETILATLLGGHGRVLDGQILTQETLGYNPDLEPFPYDPDRARELLTEAGYPDGFDLDFIAPQGRYLKDKEMAEAVTAQLADVNVRVNLRIMEFAPFIEELRGNIATCCEMYLLAIYSTPIFDADLPLPFFTTGQNLSGYSNPEVDELVAAGRRTFDTAEREAIYHQATQILYDEAAALYMFDMPSIFAHSSEITWTPRSDDVILYRDFGFAD
jgi:peptide/nickel transport system substrate-binding protein